MIASRMASGMSGIAAPRRTFSPWVVSPLLSVIVCTVSSVCLWCATRLDSHAHLCSIFQTYVGPTRSLPGGVCVCVFACFLCVLCMNACVCVRSGWRGDPLPCSNTTSAVQEASSSGLAYHWCTLCLAPRGGGRKEHSGARPPETPLPWCQRPLWWGYEQPNRPSEKW